MENQTLVSQLIAYLLFLVMSLSAPINAGIEQFKPLVFNKVLEKYGDRAYIYSIYAARGAAAFIGLWMIGGMNTVYGIIPYFERIPEVAIWILSTLLVIMGNEVIHYLIDILEAIRDSKRPEVQSSGLDLLNALASLPDLENSNTEVVG